MRLHFCILSESASTIMLHCDTAMREGGAGPLAIFLDVMLIMKNIKALVIAMSMVSAPVMAQAPAESPVAATAVTEGAMVFSADGRRIGRVDRVKSTNGAPSAVSIIYGGRFIYVPVSTLNASERGFTSTLTKAELGKL